MPWYQLSDAHDPQLDVLARQYNLHPLHIEDARSEDEGVKVDTGPNYAFAVSEASRPQARPGRAGVNRCRSLRRSTPL